MSVLNAFVTIIFCLLPIMGWISWPVFFLILFLETVSRFMSIILIGLSVREKSDEIRRIVYDLGVGEKFDEYCRRRVESMRAARGR
jgi:hypothetical protein